MSKDLTVLLKEISMIGDSELRAWTKEALCNSPEYFFTAPASSTGKYHPECTIKKGGLLIHTKRVVYIANRLSLGWKLSDKERDIVIVSSILHDIAKSGKGHGTYNDYLNHPLNAEKYFPKHEPSVEGYIDIIKKCVKYHMGPWTPDSIKKQLSEYSKLELLVYTSDYMATTKDLITPEDGLNKC